MGLLNILHRHRGAKATSTVVVIPSISIALSTHSLALTPTDSQTVTITLTRNEGYTGVVTPTLPSLPAGASVSFLPTTFSDATTSVVATITTSSAAVNTSSLSVHANGSGVDEVTSTLIVSIYDPTAANAELPREANIGPLKAWARPVPTTVELAAIVSAGRSTTVAANTEFALQSAINTAAAMTGGDRLVILPHNFSARVHIDAPINADLNHDIIIMWAHMVDGTFPIARDTRVGNENVPVGMPLWETTPAGSQEQPVIEWTQDSRKSRLKFYGIEFNIAAAATDRVCGALIQIAEYGASTDIDPQEVPYYIAFSHCYINGRKFDPDGNWRANNVWRGIYDGSRGFAFMDSVSLALGGGNADEGLYTSVIGQGPGYIHNIYSDFGGGIVMLWGGAGVPDHWPIHSDVEVSWCIFDRQNKYNKWHASAELDASGNPCSWRTKNLSEVKTAARLLWKNSMYMGQRIGDATQLEALVIKSNVQEPAARPGKTADITIQDCIILSGLGGIHISSAEHLGQAPGFVIGLNRFTLQRNMFLYGMFNAFPDVVPIRADGITVSTHAVSEHPISILAQPSRNWLVDQNYFERSPEANEGYNLLMDRLLDEIAAGGNITWKRNVWVGRYGTFTATNDSGFGFNATFDPARFEDGTVLTIEDNVIPTGTYGNSSLYPPIGTWADKTAMGISDGAGVGTRVQASDSPLLTGAHDSSRLGPNFSALASMRAILESGTVPE